MEYKLGRSAAKLMLAKTITLCISFVSAMLLSRFRTLEEYGTYSQINMAVTLTISLLALGLPNSINYYLARYDSSVQRQQFLSTYYTLSTILCVVMGGVLAFSAPLLEGYFKNPQLGRFTYVLALLPWTKVSIIGISNVLVVYGKTSKLMVVNVTNALLALGSILIVQLCGLSFRNYMLLFIISESIISVWVYHIVNHLETPLSPRLDKPLIKSILIYSIPIGLAGLVGTISLELDKLIIGYFFDTDTVAIYANAGRELPLTIVSSSLTAVLLPQMARKLKNNDTQGAVSIWGISIELSYIIISFFVTACIVFAPQIMCLLYSNKYLPGVNIFRIYSLVLLLRTTYFGIVLNSIGKTRTVFWCSIFTLFLNVILNIALYYAIGLLGPAFATFISIAITGFFQLIISAKVVRISIKTLVPWRFIARITSVNIAWGICIFIILKSSKLGTSTPDLIYAVLIGAVVMILYFLLMLRRMNVLWSSLNEESI